MGAASFSPKAIKEGFLCQMKYQNLQQKTSSQSNEGEKGQDSNWQSAVANMMGTRPLMDTRSLGTVTTMNMILMPHLREVTGALAVFGGHCCSRTSSSWALQGTPSNRDCDQTLCVCTLSLLETSMAPARQTQNFYGLFWIGV